MTRNMSLASVTWSDPSTEEKRKMASELAAIARANNLQLTLCCEDGVVPDGARPSRCIDAARMSRVAGSPIDAKPKPCRQGCGCCNNTDIRDYDTCVHGCTYCYAMSSLLAAQERHRAHEPLGAMLLPQNVNTGDQ